MKRFFPVIHCVDPSTQQGVGHTLHNTRIAYDNGADGVFLIGHGLHYRSMLDIYEQVRKQFLDGWIGVNFLDLMAGEDLCSLGELVRAVEKCHGLNALWTDDLPAIRLSISPYIEVFGGVAFKYLNPDQKRADLALACKKAKLVVDVITTSGSGTGLPPNIAKLEEIRRNIGPQARLALASGVSIDNVSSFLSTVDDFIVATSIIEIDPTRGKHEYFVRQKTRELATKIHAK